MKYKTQREYPRPPLLKALLPILAVMILILLWQLLSVSIFAGTNIFPSPVEVLDAFINEIPPENLLRDAAASISRVGIGMLAAIILGVGTGILFATSGKWGAFLSIYVEFFRPISPIAWIPIAILWFGIGEPSAYFIIFIAGFFPIFTNTFAGAKTVTPLHRDIARSLNLSNFMYLKHILIPSALPQIVTGIRIGLGFSWMAVIASEMVAAQSGLGYMIQLSRLLLLSDQVVAGMIVIGVIGFLMNRIAAWIGILFTPWAIEKNQV